MQNIHKSKHKAKEILNQQSSLRSAHVCVCECVHITVHNCHTQYSTQQFGCWVLTSVYIAQTILIIFPLILPIIIIAQMQSTGGKRHLIVRKCFQIHPLTSLVTHQTANLLHSWPAWLQGQTRATIPYRLALRSDY